MPTQTTTIVSAPYRDSLTCEECGWFQSKHDNQCSQWAEPEPDLFPILEAQMGPEVQFPADIDPDREAAMADRP